MRTFEFRLYPTKDQQVTLLRHLDICRQLYNHILESLNTARTNGEKHDWNWTSAMIPQWKRSTFPQFKEVYSKVAQMTNDTLWDNIKSLSALKKKGFRVGRLRFKGQGWYNTLNYNQSGFKIDYDHKKIEFSKIGIINAKIHRQINGKVKGIIIKHTSTDQWYACIQCDTESVLLPRTGKSVGIDLGVSKFAHDSDNHIIENPKYMQQSLAKLKTLQRSVSRKKKGSSNRRKAKFKLTKLHAHIVNQRKDHLHKASSYYIKNYDTICVEKLNIKPLTRKGKSKTLHRNILDAGWGLFFQYLSYKAQSAGRQLIKVPPQYTSQNCSQCGTRVPKELSDRLHVCPHCGYIADRDYNASLNIKKRGLEQTSLLMESRPTPLLITSSGESGR